MQEILGEDDLSVDTIRRMKKRILEEVEVITLDRSRSMHEKLRDQNHRDHGKNFNPISGRVENIRSQPPF